MIRVLFTIALRNLVKNRKRSLLIGLAIFLSCVILLSSGALANGAAVQLADRYRNYLSGDVTVSWANVKDIDPSDAGRLLFSEFDPKNKAENLAGIEAFNAFVSSNRDRVEKIHAPIRVFGMLDTGTFAAFGMIHGITEDEYDFLAENRIFALSRGESFMEFDDYAVCVSDETALTNHISIGDWISLDCQTAAGYVNSIEFNVVGTYRNSAPWDNTTIYISQKNARELLQWEPSLFSQARIYLKNPAAAPAFAAALDKTLAQAGGRLVAEPGLAVKSFYLTFGESVKSVFTFFVFFLLAVIALGIRSTVRMNVFERMHEFGTLRAIGFSPAANFFIIAFEVLALSVASLLAAIAVTLLLVAITSQTGIHTGNGVLTSLLGGEFVYPRFDAGDLLSAIVAIGVFSLLAPAKPALRLCIQKITDLLAKTQKNRFAIPYGIALLFDKISRPRRLEGSKKMQRRTV